MTYRRPDGSELVYDHRDIHRVVQEDAERQGHKVKSVSPRQHMDDAWYWHVELEGPPAEPPPPVDRTRRECIGGSNPNGLDYRELKENGQQRDYVVLDAGERGRGFVRPVRRTYLHRVCGETTSMSQPLAETYARDPGFYGATFCATCGAHYPVGEAGEFVWIDDDTKVGT